jgi:hypothetical protein
VLELEGHQGFAGEMGQLEGCDFAICCVVFTEFYVLVVENGDSAGNLSQKSIIGSLSFSMVLLFLEHLFPDLLEFFNLVEFIANIDTSYNYFPFFRPEFFAGDYIFDKLLLEPVQVAICSSGED